MKKILAGLVVFCFSLSAQEIYATFSVEAIKSANLAFESSGTVKKVYVDTSSVVKKGTKLAQLFNDDLQASTAIAKSVLQNAEVTLKYAKKDYERQLKIKSIIDEAKFDKYALAYERAKVGLLQAKANLAYKKALLAKSTIYAPFSGVIFERTLEVGDVVSGMMLRTVFKIQSQTQRKLVLEFDQKYHKEIKVGTLFSYRVDGDETQRKGAISKIYPTANSSNRKLRAEVEVESLLVGLFGDGYIILPKQK
ncbi:MAG: efflux RND transporter periplasmic adaptor subunit [Campylobacterota bacterium]|nr:efflux RND transporter periplasmic adaptor subunit [Campylobacterota bacterium]